MLISRNTVKTLHPPLKMNNHDIQEDSSHRHLGIYFSDNASWYEHINYIVKKSFVRLNILRRFRLVLDRFTLDKVYFSFIRPILEYGDVIWDSNIQNLADKIEHVQIEAMRIVTGGTKLTSINKLYDETGWEKLADQRTNHKLVLFHKMVYREVPAYLSNLLLDTLSNLNHHFTCRSQSISAIRTRTSLYTGYYLPSSIKLWNELPLEFRNITSPDIFKNRLKVINKKRPSYYYIGSRLAQVLHAKLHMDSSSLNAHLSLRNLVDNLNCTCGQTETTAHFLVQCRNYSVIRDTTINFLNLLVPITAKLLLYGSTALTDEQNTLIFTKVKNTS